jgi:Uma2 family endonuclease
MQVVLPGQALPAKLFLNPELRMTDDDYFAFCMANPNLNLERTAQGDIVIVPPPGAESAYRSTEVGGQLGIWAKQDGRGRAFGSSVEFILPTGAALSPDAAWVSNARLSTLSKDQLRKFPRLVPEFVVEGMSPSDRLKPAMEKMQEWLRGEVDLAWLIDADAKTVYIYPAGRTEPEQQANLTTRPGEGPIAGFNLDPNRHLGRLVATIPETRGVRRTAGFSPRVRLHSLIMARNLTQQNRKVDGLYFENMNLSQGGIMFPDSHSSHREWSYGSRWYFIPSGVVIVFGSCSPLSPASPVSVKCLWTFATMCRWSMAGYRGSRMRPFSL